MSEESNKYSEVFERIKTILNNKIKSIEQGSAKEFRENINNAIGTLPKDFDENGHIKKYDDGTYADGDGMTGAVYAMGDIIQVGLSELDDTLADTREATTNAIKATSDANTATQNANKATSDANTATQNANKAADNAIKATDAISGKVNKFLVVSQASVNNKPVDSSGNEIEQMPGGIWFKITSSTNSGENNTENGGIESTT